MTMNTITTHVNKEYFYRFIGVTLLFFVFSGWFVYDGLIGYPTTNATVKPIAEELLIPKDLTPEEWIDPSQTGTSPLDTIFQQHAIKTPSKYSDAFHSWVRANDPRAKDLKAAKETFTRPIYSEEDIHTQFVSAVIGAIAALSFLLVALWRKLTTFIYDGETITHKIAKKTIATYALQDLTAVNRSDWEKRGILKLTFNKTQRLTLDAWHHTGVKAIEKELPNTDEGPTP